MPFNPPTDTIMTIANITPPEIRNLFDILNLCRLASADKTLEQILTHTRSKLQTRIRCSIVSLHGRQVKAEKLTPQDFKKSQIARHITTKRYSRWKTHLQQGYNQEGLLGHLPPEHLISNPTPLSLPRGKVTLLSSLFTGHIKLQSHMYKLNLTFTPTCTCLEEDETVHHFLYTCKNYENLRMQIYPDPSDYSTIIEYTEATHRFI